MKTFQVDIMEKQVGKMYSYLVKSTDETDCRNKMLAYLRMDNSRYQIADIVERKQDIIFMCAL